MTQVQSIRLSVLGTTRGGDVLLRKVGEGSGGGAGGEKVEGSQVVLGPTASINVPLDTPCIIECARKALIDAGVACTHAPVLASVFPDTSGTKFHFLFFQEPQFAVDLVKEERETTLEVFGKEALEKLRQGGVGGGTKAESGEGEDSKEKTNDIPKTANEDLGTILSLYRPLVQELLRAAKRSSRAYPAGTTDVSTYQVEDLIDYALLDPMMYTFDRKGKGVRSQSISVLAKHFAIHEKDLASMQHCVERFHEASLVIDDIEDASELRRDDKCAYLEFGTPLTLNAAYLCVFKMLDSVPRLFRHHHDRSRELLLNGFVSAHQGQGLDIYWRDHSHCPTEEEYIGMIRGKTSTPFVMVASLFFLHSSDWRLRAQRLEETLLYVAFIILNLFGLLWLGAFVLSFFISPATVTFIREAASGESVSTSKASKRDEGSDDTSPTHQLIAPAAVTTALPSQTERAISHLFDQIGVFFQIRDDYINLTSESYWAKKGFCDDLHEKKYSFPVIHMIRRKLGRYKDLIAFFEQEEELSDEDLHTALAWIEETDALAYTRRFLFRLRDDIVATITSAGLPELDSLIIQRLAIE